MMGLKTIARMTADAASARSNFPSNLGQTSPRNAAGTDNPSATAWVDEIDVNELARAFNEEAGTTSILPVGYTTSPVNGFFLQNNEAQDMHCS